MELYAMPAATASLLEDSVVDLDQWISSEVEAAFVRALSETAFLKQEHGRLTFLSDNQEALLVWTRAEKSTRSRPARRKSAHASRKAIRAVHLSEWCGCCRWWRR